ncbi:hypothetical protein [Pseudoalteromonas sp. DL-6]|uniref:hypothetical protein n=1 Tax=Pseudoalteromonas sp. DL-6 TaxID=1390185 RepID=UPI00103C7AAA|nr:hypothetical protein [Pseudoalteromonas sp. DL-6]QBJ63535.1 hypothetical protein B1F84_11100 [Pseudoalteromonas sp. DL-6]
MDEFIDFEHAIWLLKNNSRYTSQTLLIELIESYFKQELSFYVYFDNKNGFKCEKNNPSSEYLEHSVESPYSYHNKESKIFFQDRHIGIKYSFPYYDNEEHEVYKLVGYYKLDLMEAYPRIKELLAKNLSNRGNTGNELEVTEPIERVVSENGQVWAMCSISQDIPKDEIPFTYIEYFYPQFNDLFIKRDDFFAFSALKKIKISTENQSCSGNSLYPLKRPGRAEVYAKDREEVLGAALAVLAQYRNQCVTSTGTIKGAKIAKLVIDKAPLFWPSTHEPPLENETIPKIINEWLKKVQD